MTYKALVYKRRLKEKKALRTQARMEMCTCVWMTELQKADPAIHDPFCPSADLTNAKIREHYELRNRLL
jgi:hypothetical protein